MNDYLSGILTKYTNYPRANLLYVGYLWQARLLSFKIVLKSADIERLVDLAVAAPILCRSFVLHL